MRNFLLLLLALVLTAGAGRNACAQTLSDTPENRREQAARYLAAAPPQELLSGMLRSMSAHLPPAQRERFSRLLTAGPNMDALTKAMNDSLVKTFTAEELKALADFYSSPVGRSAMSKMGAYMADVMPAVQMQVMKAYTGGAMTAPGH